MAIDVIVQHEDGAHRCMTMGNEPTIVVGFSVLISSSERRVPQDHPTDNPILNAAKRELAERTQTAVPLRAANDAYDRPARIVSINTSAQRAHKSPVADGRDTVIEQFGLASDAHAGHWHRQVSFFWPQSPSRRRRLADSMLREGDFGENFTTQGINLLSLPLGTQLKLGSEVLVEISQIGKVCHTLCYLLSAGDCIFPHEGIFGVVLKGRRSISATISR